MIDFCFFIDEFTDPTLLSPLASPCCPSPDSFLLSVSTVLDVLLSLLPCSPVSSSSSASSSCFPLSHPLFSSRLCYCHSLPSPPNLPIPSHTYFSPHLPLFFPPCLPIFASRPLVFLSFPRPIIHLPFTSPPFCLPHSLPLSLLFLCAGKQDTAEQIPAEFLLLRYTLVYTQTHAYAHT